MATVIAQRELRNDNAEIMRRVAAGESFTVTRNGQPIADLIPHQTTSDAPELPRKTLGELQKSFQTLPPINKEQWFAEQTEADEFFGPDDPLEDPWEHFNTRAS